VKFSETITSPANPRLRRVMQLRDAGSRRETGLSLVDGLRELSRAAASGVEVVEVFVACPEASVSPDRSPSAGNLGVLECVAACADRGAEIVGLSSRAFARLAFGDRDEGVVGVVRFAARGLKDVAFAPRRPVLVAEGVEKPGNLGAILRTADAAGLGGVIACDPRTDPANPATIRASLGTVFSVPLAVAAVGDVVRWCHDSGRRVILATPDAERDWFRVDLTGAVTIVVGSEAAGISGCWTAAAADGGITLDAVRLPMRGRADSLNVSVTAAVLAYESVRQEACRADA